MRKKIKRKLDTLGEFLLMRLAAACVIVLLITQVLLIKDSTRIYLSKVDKLEGVQVSLQSSTNNDAPLTIKNQAVIKRPQILRENRVLVIKMISPKASDDVHVKVNGEVYGNFKQGYVKLTVYDGDYVEINTAMLTEPGQFIVVVPDNNLSWPESGQLLEGQGKLIEVGKVKFKR